MRKIVVGIVLLFAFVSSVFAIGNVGIFVDYTTVSMAKVNDQIQLMADSMSSLPPPYIPTVTKFGSGLIFGAVAGISVMPMLDIGVRAGYLYAFPGTIKLDISKGGYYMKLNVNFDASMIPIEGGFSFKLALPASPISLGAGVYAGYGLANSKLSMKIETNIPSAPNGSVEVPMQGGCLVVDILANAGMSIGPAMSLGLELGYRIANVSEMKSTQAVSNTDLGFEFAKDEVVKDENGDPVPFDFSGFVAGLKFTIGF